MKIHADNRLSLKMGPGNESESSDLEVLDIKDTNG